MNEKCEICGGPKKPMALSHSTGWAAHNGNECLLELRRRIEALEQHKEDQVRILPPPDEELDIQGRGHILVYHGFTASEVSSGQRIRSGGKEWLVTAIEGAQLPMGTVRDKLGIGLLVVPRG